MVRLPEPSHHYGDEPMRLNPYAVRPDAYKAVLGLTRELAKGPLESSLRSLVETRVSQLNRCGFCLAMHADSARGAGVSQDKLDTLAGWREDSGYSTRERAALAVAEALTILAEDGVSDEVWNAAAREFTDEELGDLLYLVGQMNLFNRLNLATRFPANRWREQGHAGLRANPATAH
jgi:AhpD family alkylhydroperoxidase